jgi:hypothetical protein
LISYVSLLPAFCRVYTDEQLLRTDGHYERRTFTSESAWAYISIRTDGSYAMSLREIDSKRVDGKFVDAEGNKAS